MIRSFVCLYSGRSILCACRWTGFQPIAASINLTIYLILNHSFINTVIQRAYSVFLQFFNTIEYEIFGEGSHISTNQKRENRAFSPLIG